MSTITKEWLQSQISAIKAVGITESNTLQAFEIALASLEAKPIGAFHIADQQVGGTTDYIKDGEWPIDDGVIEVYAAPPAPVSVPDYPETLPCPVMLDPGLRFGKGVPTKTMLGALLRRAEYHAELEAMTPEQRAEHDAGMKEFAAMLQDAEPVTTVYKLPANTPCKEAPEYIWLQTAGVWPENGEFSELTWCSDNQHQDDTLYVRADVVTGNSPVIPDGWVACRERMPEDEQEVLTRNKMGHCFVSFFDEHSGLFFDRIDVAAACCIEHILVTHWMPLPAAPQQEVK